MNTAIRQIRSSRVELSGWGRLRREACNAYRPTKLAELAATLNAEHPQGIIPRGMGRSYGDSATLREGSVLLCDRLNRFCEFNEESGCLTCEAGVTFEEILEIFIPRGFFLPVTPGTKYVTVGGAIAADVHGKNHHIHGSLGNFVESFDLLTSRHGLLRCSRQENAEAFWATLGGMGLTGIIVRATIRLIRIKSAYVVVNHQRAANLDELVANSLQQGTQSTYSVAWIDCVAGGSAMGRGVLMTGEHATIDQLPANLKTAPLHGGMVKKRNVPFDFPSFALSTATVRAFNNRYFSSHPDREGIVQLFDTFFYPLDSISNWNRIYGRRGFLQYQALFPTETSRAGIRRLLAQIVAAQVASFLAVLKITGEASGGVLSFCQPGVTLALDIPNQGERLEPVMRRLDKIVLEHGGRLYLAKDSMTDHTTFAVMYPRLDEFKKIRASLDPTGRFVSDQANRLGIV